MRRRVSLAKSVDLSEIWEFPMPIAGSCVPSNPSSAFERPMVNATMGVAMASRSRSVFKMFRVARSGAAVGASVISTLVSAGGLLPAWLAPTMVSGVALALASASSFAAIRVRRVPVVRVLHVSAWSLSLRQGCPRRVRRQGNLRTARRPDEFRDRSFQTEPPQMARR
eukprot:5141942-Pleurochrysis_carterae.AAC.1